MSYQALARKWRPKNFEEVIGQEHVVSALSNALASQRVHHAFLFTGTRGVGKTTLARIFAKALNCEQGVSATPCGECVACRGVEQGNFVDLIEVDAASRTRVDDTRELLDNVQYTPTQGRYKIYLIDEVHMLSGHSFNALLKTLEEPPEHVKFLLATTDPQKLPTTILSRCIQFNLRAMDIGRLVAQLDTILAAESIAFDEQALMILSRSADGSVRDALSLLDQAIAYGNGEVRSDQVRSMLGMIDDQFVLQLLEQIGAGQGAEILETIADMVERAADFGNAIDEVLSALHNISLYQVNPQAVEWKGVDSSLYAELASKLDAELLQLLFQIALVGKRDLPLAPDPRTGFEMVMLRMVAFQPDGGSAATGPQRRQPKTAAATPSAPAPAPESKPEPGSEPEQAVSVDEIASTEGWSRYIRHSGLGGMAREMAMNMVPESLREEVFTLTLDAEHRHLMDDRRIARIRADLTTMLGRELELAVIVREVGSSDRETPSRQRERLREEKQVAAEQAFGNDPNVQALVDLFDAEIIDDSVRPAQAEGESGNSI